MKKIILTFCLCLLIPALASAGPLAHPIGKHAYQVVFDDGTFIAATPDARCLVRISADSLPVPTCLSTKDAEIAFADIDVARDSESWWSDGFCLTADFCLTPSQSEVFYELLERHLQRGKWHVMTPEEFAASDLFQDP